MNAIFVFVNCVLCGWMWTLKMNRNSRNEGKCRGVTYYIFSMIPNISDNISSVFEKKKPEIYYDFNDCDTSACFCQSKRLTYKTGFNSHLFNTQCTISSRCTFRINFSCLFDCFCICLFLFSARNIGKFKHVHPAYMMFMENSFNY